jgi:hypothetical protein
LRLGEGAVESIREEFRATRRPDTRSSARYTVPRPPAPSFRRIAYRPAIVEIPRDGEGEETTPAS